MNEVALPLRKNQSGSSRSVKSLFRLVTPLLIFLTTTPTYLGVLPLIITIGVPNTQGRILEFVVSPHPFPKEWFAPDLIPDSIVEFLLQWRRRR